MRFSFILAAAAVLSTALSARADTFKFTYTGSGLNGAGTLSTAGAASSGFVSLASFGGVQNGNAITLLRVNQFAGNDNLFSSSLPHFDFSGLSYSVSGVQYNLYGNGAGQTFVCTACNGNQNDGTPVAFTTMAITPEISSAALLGTGLLGIVGLMKRRSRKSSQVPCPCASGVRKV